MATQWPLTAAGPSTITGATGDGTITAATVPVGTYALSEGTGPAGYAASAWVCTGATSSTADSVTLAAGQNATCTITNDDIAPRLTLVKTVTNDNGGTASETDWDLTATGPSTITGSTGDPAITDALVTAGSYTLSEAGPVGYAPGAWLCTGGAVSGAVVTVPVGADVTCTINNDDIEPLLTLVKTVDNGNTGGTATSANWTLTADGPTPITGVSGAPVVTSANVTAGEYDLSESTGPAGYELSALVCSDANGPIETVSVTDPTVSIAPGAVVTCTFTNTAVPATLTLVKVVGNGETGGTAVPANWTLEAEGPTPISGASGSPTVTAVPVAVGTYDLTETAGPAGYDLTGLVCSDANGPIAGTSPGSPTVTIALGDAVTCTFTNVAVSPRLTLVKVVENSFGGSALVTDWTLQAAGSTTIEGVSGSGAVTNAPLPVGSYDLSELDGPTGYDLTTLACVDGAGAPIAGVSVDAPQLTLALEDAVTCTFTNTELQPNLTLVKLVDNASSGGTAAAGDWTLTATPISIPGQSPVQGSGDPTAAGGVNAVPVSTGQYTLAESGPSGYTAGSWSCVGGTVTGAVVTVPSGAAVTCTIQNTATAPTLTLIKTVTNDNGGTATESAWTSPRRARSPSQARRARQR